MTKYYAGYEELLRDFRQKRIPVEQPGFYDAPGFMQVEQQNPAYLNNYARFVSTKPYDEVYLKRARVEVPIIVKELHTELVSEGRLGACVDASGILSRMLEQEGIWNYIVKGSFTISFPRNSGVETKYFWSVDTGDFVAGHAWIYAPPYLVVDITLRQQPYKGRERDFLPEILTAEETSIATAEPDDILSPEVRMMLSMQGFRGQSQLRTICPQFLKFTQTFPAHMVTLGELRLKYIPFGITAPSEPLKNIRNMSFGGKSGFDVYMEKVKPALETFRSS